MPTSTPISAMFVAAIFSLALSKRAIPIDEFTVTQTCIRIVPSLHHFTRLWTSLREVVLIFNTIHRTLIASSICYLILRPRQYASMVRLTKPDAGNVTGSVNSSHICFKVTRLSKMLGILERHISPLSLPQNFIF